MNEFIKALDQHPGISIIVAFTIAFIGWLIGFIKDSRNQYKMRRNLLEAVKLELYFNQQWIIDLIPQGEDTAEYYDPTRANFKLRDDAVNYAITNGQSILLSEKNIIANLIKVSHAVRYVNQQIDEQMMTRFCSPEFSSKMSSLVINNQRLVFDWVKNPDTIPNELKEYADELHLRHWAINNIGFWQQLKPSLEKAIPLVDKIIEQIDKNKKWWHFWKS